ncbi:MAG: membrane protein insertion efficiency factor YidD [Bacteroidales bacterium]|nr:membrane protein insertion efficiency factor YidD [Bacteroidales bacterium]
MFKLLSKISFLLFFLVLTISLSGQSFQEDFTLVFDKVQEKSHDAHAGHKHLPVFLLSDHPSALVRFNPFTLAFGGLLWGYQTMISPQLSATCIYSPSCSAYSKNLLQEYGILRGVIFTADRISRCNRLALYDYPPWEIDFQIHKVREQIDYYQIK